MRVGIKQSTTYERDNWWKWSVWVEATADALDQIESVDYILHPTFPLPSKRVTTRKTNFRLDSAGWGEFLIHAHVHTKDGRTKKLSHWLELKYPTLEKNRIRESAPARGLSSEERRPVIFLSCNVADMPFASVLNKALTAEGVEVLMVEDQPSDLPWEASINLLLNRADLVLFIFSDSPNTWMRREIEASKERKIPIMTIVIMTGKVNLKELPPEIGKPLRIKPVLPEESKKEARHVAKRVLRDLGSRMAEANRKRAPKR